LLNERALDGYRLAAFLPLMTRMSLELFIGRGLAFCLHPAAAWRVLPVAGRAAVVAAYAAAAYVSVLGVLLFR
jgi:hypothetical protein